MRVQHRSALTTQPRFCSQVPERQEQVAIAGVRLGDNRCRIDGDHEMLGWALIFFLLALVAGYLGFFGLAGLAASIAKVLFILFLVVLVLGFIVRAFRGESVT